MRKLSGIVIAVLLLVITGLCAFIYFDKVVTAQNAYDPGKELRYEFVDIGKLATQEYNYTRVKVLENEKLQVRGFQIPFTSSKCVFSYDGTITAGIDFSAIEYDINEDKKTITLKLPEAEILSNELDYDSYKIYDEDKSVIHPISPMENNESLIEFKKEALEAAIEKGILIKATENAKILLKNMIIRMDLKDYTLVIK